MLHCDKTLTPSAGIYLILHRDSGKLYVGSAISLLRRHGEHQRMLRRNHHENDHLQKAWNRHGAEAFVFIVLLVCAPDDLIYYEQRTLDHFKGKIGWRRMYNSSPTAGSRRGLPKSIEERAKISARMMGNQYTKGRSLSAEHRAKIAITTRRRNLGNKLSEETKRKIGNANRGRKVSAETRARLSAVGKGRRPSSETLAKLALSPKFRGKRHSPESKAKISQSLRDRVFSDEHRAKISIGVRAYRERLRRELA